MQLDFWGFVIANYAYVNTSAWLCDIKLWLEDGDLFKLGGKFDFFSPWGFSIESDFDYKPSKSSSSQSEL